jgi:hypothetical protein
VTTGLPCAVALRLTSLPGEPRVATVTRAMLDKHHRELGACMGAPGPHDFAVRIKRRSSVGASASTASRLTFRDDRDTPLCIEAGRAKECN